MGRERWTEEHQNIRVNDILPAPQLPIIETFSEPPHSQVLLYIDDFQKQYLPFFPLLLRQFLVSFLGLLKLCLFSSLALILPFLVYYISFNGGNPAGFSILT